MVINKSTIFKTDTTSDMAVQIFTISLAFSKYTNIPTPIQKEDVAVNIIRCRVTFQSPSRVFADIGQFYGSRYQ